MEVPQQAVAEAVKSDFDFVEDSIESPPPPFITSPKKRKTSGDELSDELQKIPISMSTSALDFEDAVRDLFSSPPPRPSSLDGYVKPIVVSKKMQRIPQLLLSASYKLFNKELIYGYSQTTFEPTFCFVNEKNFCISLNSTEFIEFCTMDFASLWKEDCFLTPHVTLPKKRVFKSNPNMQQKLTTRHHQRVLVFENEFKDSRMVFDLQDLDLFSRLQSLFLSRVPLMEGGKESVKQFFMWYVDLCRGIKSPRLPSDYFCYPNNAIMHVDYFQLFLEIPSFMRERIVLEMNKTVIAHSL